MNATSKVRYVSLLHFAKAEFPEETEEDWLVTIVRDGLSAANFHRTTEQSRVRLKRALHALIDIHKATCYPWESGWMCWVK